VPLNESAIHYFVNLQKLTILKNKPYKIKVALKEKTLHNKNNHSNTQKRQMRKGWWPSQVKERSLTILKWDNKKGKMRFTSNFMFYYYC
jgi:hypothetical protein